jgi:hypothetical protein
MAWTLGSAIARALQLQCVALRPIPTDIQRLTNPGSVLASAASTHA